MALVILQCSMNLVGKTAECGFAGEMVRRAGKKKPATLRCGLKSNSLRRKLEETGATLMLRTKTIYFISQISDIRFGDKGGWHLFSWGFQGFQSPA